MSQISKLRSFTALFLRNRLGLQVNVIRKRGEERFPGYVNQEFPSLYRKYCHDTMVPWQGLYGSWLAARHIGYHRVPGAIVECGVYKGGCSMIMAEAAYTTGRHDIDIWLYDTFTGMAEPTEHDFKGGLTAKDARINAQSKFEQQKRGDYVDWCLGPLEEVRAVVQRGPLAPERVHLVQGKVEETIPSEVPEQISLLRLDTDFYESTKHELEYLYPRLSPSGILIIDDYGAWAGARKAVDEYFTDPAISPLLVPDSYYGALVGLKPPAPDRVRSETA